jgi:hypothetical protein
MRRRIPINDEGFKGERAIARRTALKRLVDILKVGSVVAAYLVSSKSTFADDFEVEQGGTYKNK